MYIIHVCRYSFFKQSVRFEKQSDHRSVLYIVITIRYFIIIYESFNRERKRYVLNLKTPSVKCKPINLDRVGRMQYE